MTTRISTRPWAVLVPVTALAAGLLFATSASTANGTDLRADRRLQLTELISRERGEVARRQRDVDGLRAEVDAGTARVAQQDSRIGAATAPAMVVGAAGLAAVTGPGLRVELDDAPRRAGRPALSDDPDDLVVHQQDVQSVVNALWAGGAEAMTLVGQRVVSTSAVRCVGNTIILHGRVYSPPFRVEAIGSSSAMRAALEQDRGVRLFQQYVDVFGLGYTVEGKPALALPAYDGPLELPNVAPVAQP